MYYILVLFVGLILGWRFSEKIDKFVNSVRTSRIVAKIESLRK